MNKKAFSIIEVLVWIFIFSLWIVSVFSVIQATLNLNYQNKNYIIAANLAREQIELFRNIRDSNYAKIQIWNQINPNLDEHESLFETGSYYKLENIFSIPSVSIDSFFPIVWSKLDNIDNKDSYKLCLDDEKRYTYDCDWNNEKTLFYRYIEIQEVKWAENEVIENAVKVISKVIWNYKGDREFEINSIFTDFKRF
jgi:type II secretory pathway pseudopilin PulG